MDVLSITLGISTALSGSGAIFLWVETHTSGGRSRREKKLGEKIDTHLTQALKPLEKDVTSLHSKLDEFSHSRNTAIQTAIHEAMEPVRDQIATLNTKIEIPWRVLEQIAVANAQLIHKPHPENAGLDILLDKYEAFMRGTGQFTVDEELRLRHYLNMIKAWKPGQHIGIYVEEGDPTRAAIVLATMELTRIRRRHPQQEDK